jgi:hypothetical protein
MMEDRPIWDINLLQLSHSKVGLYRLSADAIMRQVLVSHIETVFYLSADGLGNKFKICLYIRKRVCANFKHVVLAKIWSETGLHIHFKLYHPN